MSDSSAFLAVLAFGILTYERWFVSRFSIYSLSLQLIHVRIFCDHCQRAFVFSLPLTSFPLVARNSSQRVHFWHGLGPMHISCRDQKKLQMFYCPQKLLRPRRQMQLLMQLSCCGQVLLQLCALQGERTAVALTQNHHKLMCICKWQAPLPGLSAKGCAR